MPVVETMFNIFNISFLDIEELLRGGHTVTPLTPPPSDTGSYSTSAPASPESDVPLSPMSTEGL